MDKHHRRRKRDYQLGRPDFEWAILSQVESRAVGRRIFKTTRTLTGESIFTFL